MTFANRARKRRSGQTFYGSQDVARLFTGNRDNIAWSAATPASSCAPSLIADGLGIPATKVAAGTDLLGAGEYEREMVS